jgi:LPS sulfotransferase NodH
LNQKKFIVLSTQRTGSAFLEQCINSHEDIVCHGEILLGYGGHYTDLPPKWLKSHRRLRTLWQAIASGAFLYPKKTMEMTWNTKSPQEWRGFRLMYNQINRDPRVMHYLNNHTEIKVIHLQRRNLLKQYISLYLMHNQSRYGRYEAHVTKKPSQIKVRVDQNKALDYFRSFEKTRNNILLKFKEFERLDIFYEDMIGNGGLADDVTSKISTFLGIPKALLVSDQVKINSKNLEDIVDNYTDLKRLLENTKYKNWLYED